MPKPRRRRARLTPQERTQRRREAAEAARRVDPRDPFAAPDADADDAQHKAQPWTKEDVDAHRGTPSPAPVPTTQDELLSRAVDLLAEIRDLLAKEK